jgi:hypothetical protein
MDSERLLQRAIERGAADLRLSGGNLPPLRLADEMRGLDRPPAIHLSAIVHHAPGGCRVRLNGQSVTPAALPFGIESLADAVGQERPAWQGGRARPVGRFALQPDQGCLAASGRGVEGPGPSARQTARHQDGAPR